MKNQNFDKQRFEMIVVNDHSEDSTLKILEKSAKSWENLKIICMNEGEQGKKNAIKKGISCANGSVILCTDADCRAGENWIKTIANYFTDKSVKLLSAPVEFHYKKDIFQKNQKNNNDIFFIGRYTTVKEILKEFGAPVSNGVVIFSVNESGELVSSGGKSYVCNRADYNLNNNKKSNKRSI